MNERFTVGEMAARLARANPEFPAGYYARQIRGWAQARLFGYDVEVKGKGRTAAQVFQRHHLAMARIYSALTRLGFTADALATVRACFDNMRAADTVNVPDAPQGIKYVLAYHALPSETLDWKTYRLWAFTIYSTESGVVWGGGFTQDGHVNAIAAAGGPIAVTIAVSGLFGDLFMDDETFAAYAADRDRLRSEAAES